LGLPASGWTRRQLSAKYKQEALKTHPDKKGGSHKAFLAVKQAYDFLRKIQASWPGVAEADSTESESEAEPESQSQKGKVPHTNSAGSSTKVSAKQQHTKKMTQKRPQVHRHQLPRIYDMQKYHRRYKLKSSRWCFDEFGTAERRYYRTKKEAEEQARLHFEKFAKKSRQSQCGLERSTASSTAGPHTPLPRYVQRDRGTRYRARYKGKSFSGSLAECRKWLGKKTK